MDAADGLSRREALRRGALGAGALWVVPALHVLRVSAAHAQAPSAPAAPAADPEGEAEETSPPTLPKTT
jgi:hypothetical protein